MQDSVRAFHFVLLSGSPKGLQEQFRCTLRGLNPVRLGSSDFAVLSLTFTGSSMTFMILIFVASSEMIERRVARECDALFSLF